MQKIFYWQNPQLSAIEREKLVVDFVLDNKSNEQYRKFWFNFKSDS